MAYVLGILVVLIAVGALAYWGVLSPDKYFPLSQEYQEIADSCHAPSKISEVACINSKHDSLNLTDCEDSAMYYVLAFRNLGLKNQRVYTSNHVFNIVYSDDFYCIVDGDYLQCISIK